MQRRGLAAASGGTPRQLRRVFGDKLAERLDVMPELVWSDAADQRVMKLVEDADIGPVLHDRFRSHPGQRCSFEPTLIIAAAILGVMSGLSAELTDVLRSMNALPPWARHHYGVTAGPATSSPTPPCITSSPAWSMAWTRGGRPVMAGPGG